MGRVFDLIDLIGKVARSAFVRETVKVIAWGIAFFGPAFFIGFVIEPNYDLGKEGWAWLLFGIWGVEGLLWWAHSESVKSAVDAKIKAIYEPDLPRTFYASVAEQYLGRPENRRVIDEEAEDRSEPDEARRRYYRERKEAITRLHAAVTAARKAYEDATYEADLRRASEISSARQAYMDAIHDADGKYREADDRLVEEEAERSKRTAGSDRGER